MWASPIWAYTIELLFHYVYFGMHYCGVHWITPSCTLGTCYDAISSIPCITLTHSAPQCSISCSSLLPFSQSCPPQPEGHVQWLGWEHTPPFRHGGSQMAAQWFHIHQLGIHNWNSSILHEHTLVTQLSLPASVTDTLTNADTAVSIHTLLTARLC